MDTDDRFKHLASDPRFKTLRKKQRKVQVDERFQSMFTDERFTLKSSKDKRGRKHKKKSGDDLTKYYTLEKEKKGEEEEEEEGVDEDKDDAVVNEESDSDDQEEIEDWTEKVEDEDDDVAANEDEEVEEDIDDEEEEEEEEETDQSEVSSSSDESESEDEGVDDVKAIQYDWQPLDHDAEKAETVTRRLAIQNLDWTHLDVRDIYTLVNSIRPPLNVRVYISEFGKERLAKEEIEGPEELVDMPQIDEEEEEYNLLKSRMEALESKDSKAKTFKVNEYEDADEVLDMKNEEIRERIRRYQLSRMKYYYAIAEFDSVESAEAVYKELDGIEYEGSSLELDLRFVPDEMEFDRADMKSECSKVPDLATYKAPQFINSALQQTTVKFTWDETDVKRQEKLQRAYTKEELEKDDLDAYLASDDSDEDEDVDEKSPVDKNADGRITTTTSETDKYKKLLKSLDEEAERKKKVDVDVVWGDYEGDEKRTASAAAGKQDKSGGGGGGHKQSEDRATSKRKSEGKSTKKKPKGKNNGEHVDDSDDDDDDAHLDLLVMDARKQEEFKFNPDDDRFGAVYESGLYNIDPSHPNFKRTQAFDQMAEKKREKRWKSSR